MKRLFVIMPFGIKSTDKPHNVESIDFDFVYSHLIRPAASAAAFEALRIDEVVEPGTITHQYLKEILEADVVLADISLSNANVYYELGIRQAISSGGTILIALTNSRIPFDLANQRVFFYDLSTEVLEQNKQTLIQALNSQHAKPAENPIRSFLDQILATANPNIDRDAFEQELQGRITRAQNAEQLIAVWRWASNLSPLPPFTLLTLARRLADFEEWTHSVAVLSAAVAIRPNDFELNRELGWHTSKLGLDYAEEAIASLKRALDLNPDDPETLGMIAGVFKRKADFVQAAEYYSRGVAISPNLYMLVNQAAMQVFLAPQDPVEGIALYHNLKHKILSALTQQGSLDEWQEIVLGEALFVIHNLDSAKPHFLVAKKLASSPKSLRSAADQLELFARSGFKSEEANELAEWVRALADETLQLGRVRERDDDVGTEADDKLPVFLHLSDLHFGRKTTDGGPSEDMHRFFDGEYSKELSHHIIEEFAGKHAHFKHDASRLHLMVSGDLTYTGQTAEFDLVLQFLSDVCEKLNISKSRVHIVPGNHDIDWKLAKVNLSFRFDNYIQFLDAFYGEELFRAKHPQLTWDLRVNSKRPEPWDLVSFHREPDIGVVILGLNSCVYETHQDHYGLIGGRQLKQVEKLLEVSSDRDVRVAMFHHHLHPFPEFIQADEKSQVEMDLSIIRDSGIVEKQLEKLKFDLVLHGHKHKPQIRETIIKASGDTGRDNMRLVVCGAGSVGVSSSELEHNVPNQYQVIEVLRSPRRRSVDFLRVEWRTLDVSPEADWITPGSWIVSG